MDRGMSLLRQGKMYEVGAVGYPENIFFVQEHQPNGDVILMRHIESN